MNMKNDVVRKAVDECIEEGILEEFFTKNRAEVIDVSILEYDKEKVLRFVREEGFEDGRTLGMTEGKVLGKSELILDLLSDLGNVPKDMKNRIMTEKDAVTLSRWNRLAAKSESIGEFEAKM